MTAVDPLILEIRADLSRYRAQLQSTTSLVTTSLGRQEKSVQNLERQMQRSSGAISGSLKGIAGAIAGAFSVQQIGALVDNFTRLQNSLKVAGLEGESLANVQAKLLDLSGRYGVSINELANLYGKSSQAASDLGASEAQLLQITEASAQALKITGTSAVQAQGALLGLTQALSSGIVRAEEFNQINEGGLRPLLQVAANTERFGGSVAKLRAAVVEGQLSSQEFYQAILQGSAELEGKASKATLTLAGAFTALASQLTVYVGEASAANGVTAGLAAGIDALADNLDTVIPILATIATFMGTKYVVSAIAAGSATAAFGTALFAFRAYAGGAATAMEALNLVMRANPAGIVITAISALAAGLVYFSAQSETAAKATSATTEAVDKLNNIMKQDVGAKVANDARSLAAARLAQANATYKAAAAEIALRKSQASSRLKDLEDGTVTQNQRNGRGGISTTETTFTNRALALERAKAKKQFDDAAKDETSLNTAFAKAKQDVISGGSTAPTPPPTTSPSTSRAGRATGLSGLSAEELLSRADSDQRRLDAEVLQAKAQLAVNAEERAEFEKQILELEKAQRLADLTQSTGLSEDQRKAQKAVIDELYGTAAELDAQGEIVVAARPGLIAQQINRDKEAQSSQERADAAELEKQVLLETLGTQADLATSIKDRRRLALDIVDAEFNALIASLEEAKLQSGISDEKRKQLDAEIALTKIRQGRAQNDAKNGNLTPTAQYLKEINETNFGDEEDKFGVAALKDLNAGLADAIVNGGNLGDVLEDTGKRFLAQLIELTFQLLVIKPLLESLGDGGIGGAVSGVLSLFGGKSRASGGPVSAGQVYRVNEGTRPEYFKPNTGGDIIPLSKMSAAPMANAQGGVSVIRLELSGDIDARIVSTSAQVAVEVVRANVPSIVDQSAAKARYDIVRPRM